MTHQPTIEIHWRNLPIENEVRESLTRRCEHLANKFSGAESFELSLESEGNEIECHGHVAGRRTRLAAHSSGTGSTRQAAEAVLKKLETEMRRQRDKRTFGARRKAQKTRSKRLIS